MMRKVAAFALLAMVAALAACSTAPSTGPSTPPGGSPNGSTGASAVPTDVPGPSDPGGPGSSPGVEPSQTDTDWGRIWDAVPPTFPRPPGARPSEPVGRGPSSAEYAVGTSPVDVTDFYRRSLEAAGYATADVSGPLEDGSRVVESVGVEPGCRIRTTVTPLGGVTHVTILFGAACPYR